MFAEVQCKSKCVDLVTDIQIFIQVWAWSLGRTMQCAWRERGCTVQLETRWFHGLDLRCHPDASSTWHTRLSSYSSIFLQQVVSIYTIYTCIYIYSKCENMSFASFGFESKFVVGPVTVCQWRSQSLSGPSAERMHLYLVRHQVCLKDIRCFFGSL